MNGATRRFRELPRQLVRRARELRSGQTDAEQHLWRLLRSRQMGGFKFRRQYPAPPYVIDFYCPELKLGVEVDGGQHLERGEAERDASRSAALARRGIRILRFGNRQVLRRTDEVVGAIWDACQGRALVSDAEHDRNMMGPSPKPSPCQGEGHVPGASTRMARSSGREERQTPG